jgi:hypothetical protein
MWARIGHEPPRQASGWCHCPDPFYTAGCRPAQRSGLARPGGSRDPRQELSRLQQLIRDTRNWARIRQAARGSIRVPPHHLNQAPLRPRGRGNPARRNCPGYFIKVSTGVVTQGDRQPGAFFVNWMPKADYDRSAHVLARRVPTCRSPSSARMLAGKRMALLAALQCVVWVRQPRPGSPLGELPFAVAGRFPVSSSGLRMPPRSNPAAVFRLSGPELMLWLQAGSRRPRPRRWI